MPDHLAAAGGGRTDGGAIASLVLGILAAVGFFPPIGVILGVTALVMGRRADRRIRQSAGALDGRGMAKAGWILGIVGIVLGVLSVVFLAIIIILFDQLDQFGPVRVLP